MAGSRSIKLFKFTQKTYQDIGIFPLASASNQNQNRSPINSKNWFILFCLAEFFISSVAYLLFEANSMIEYEMASFTCATVLTCIIYYLILFWQMENILNHIENCEKFIEKRLHKTSVYKDTNDKIEQITELFAYAMVVISVTVALLPLPYTFVNYYFLQLKEESFFLFFPTWWPFDWKTPFGYIVAWLAQCAGIEALAKSCIGVFNIIFASCCLFIVIAEDITNDVSTFNSCTGETLKHSDLRALMDRLCNIIRHYSDAKQCITSFNEMNKYSMFAYFSWFMLTISSLLMTLQFQLWDDDSKLFEIMIQFAVFLFIFVFNLVICEYGELVSYRFDEFGGEFCRCEWYNLPIKMRRIYLIFLLDIQQPKNIQIVDGIPCTCETFKKITTNGFSYFMILRRFRL